MFLQTVLYLCHKYDRLSDFFGIERHVALDRNMGPRNHTLLLRFIPGDLYSACQEDFLF